MGNPQKVTYQNVRAFLADLPPGELEIVEVLRQLIVETIPNCKEKLAYNVPFYYGYSRICYIWPASVPWGGVKEGVVVGFLKGYLLTTMAPQETRQLVKQVFTCVDDIDVTRLRDQLYEAALLDAEEARNKKNRGRKR